MGDAEVVEWRRMTAGRGEETGAAALRWKRGRYRVSTGIRKTRGVHRRGLWWWGGTVVVL